MSHVLHVTEALQLLEADLAEREAALAAAMELTSVDRRVQAAFFDGIAEERARVITLINAQIEMLSRASISHAVLIALRKAVEGDG
jgi:hypothetical protein